MKIALTPSLIKVGLLRYLGTVIICILISIMLLSCNDAEQQVLELEATLESMNESLDALGDENIELKAEVANLRQRLVDRETRIEELEQASSKGVSDILDKEQWSKEDNAKWSDEDLERWAESKGERSSISEATEAERTARLAEDAGGQVHYIENAGRGGRTVLVTPQDFIDGSTPLIVSLHGFGSNAADHAAYFPLHERANSDGFALLLPTGSLNAEGLPFWNPTDHCCEGGKSGEDDIGYLTDLVAEAEKIKDFGPIYFFGYSNGGFMSHHMACKGLPGLRAVASLAGTSYVEASSCDGAPPVSVLHIHGTDDSVIMYEGAETEPDSGGERAFYLGAEAMVARWSQIAGCDWPEDPKPRATLDLDQYVPDAETQVFREASFCTDGINIELWKGNGSSHSPGYTETFIDALLSWLLAQK